MRRGGGERRGRTKKQPVEVAREEADVVVRRRRGAVQQRRDRVQDEHRAGVRHQQPDCNPVQSNQQGGEGKKWGKGAREKRTGSPIPRRVRHIDVLERRSLDAVDQRAPHPHLPHHLVQRRAAHEELLRRVRCCGDSSGWLVGGGRGGRTESVERGADDHERVALAAGERGVVLVGEEVGADEHAEAAD